MKITLAVLLVFPALLQAGSLDFENLVKEENATMDATTVVSDFAFTNKSEKPVTITKADPTCSCLKVEISGGKFTYAPGESGVIRTTFDVGNSTGLVEKGVVVFLDKDPPTHPSLQLKVNIHIPVLVELDPKTLSWEIGGKSETKTIHIRIADGNSVNVLSAASSNPVFATELKTIEKGAKYELLVTPKVMDVAGIGIVRIETDSKIAKQKTVQAFAVVRRGAAAPDVSKR